ncbi:hypothetical protein GQ42DRAFT_161288, partial [Ramicandelaber brevisporus]
MASIATASIAIPALSDYEDDDRDSQPAAVPGSLTPAASPLARGSISGADQLDQSDQTDPSAAAVSAVAALASVSPAMLNGSTPRHQLASKRFANIGANPLSDRAIHTPTFGSARSKSRRYTASNMAIGTATLIETATATAAPDQLDSALPSPALSLVAENHESARNGSVTPSISFAHSSRRLSSASAASSSAAFSSTITSSTIASSISSIERKRHISAIETITAAESAGGDVTPSVHKRRKQELTLTSENTLPRCTASEGSGAANGLNMTSADGTPIAAAKPKGVSVVTVSTAVSATATTIPWSKPASSGLDLLQSSQNALAQPVTAADNGTAPLLCSHCGKSYTNEASFRKHRWEHHPLWNSTKTLMRGSFPKENWTKHALARVLECADGLANLKHGVWLEWLQTPGAR